MARYYFDVRDGPETFIDATGIELPDMDAAVKQARRALADMFRDALRAERENQVAIEIRDGADGPVLLTVTLTTDRPGHKT